MFGAPSLLFSLHLGAARAGSLLTGWHPLTCLLDRYTLYIFSIVADLEILRELQFFLT